MNRQYNDTILLSEKETLMKQTGRFSLLLVQAMLLSVLPETASAAEKTAITEGLLSLITTLAFIKIVQNQIKEDSSGLENK